MLGNLLLIWDAGAVEAEKRIHREIGVQIWLDHRRRQAIHGNSLIAHHRVSGLGLVAGCSSTSGSYARPVDPHRRRMPTHRPYMGHRPRLVTSLRFCSCTGCRNGLIVHIGSSSRSRLRRYCPSSLRVLGTVSNAVRLQHPRRSLSKAGRAGYLSSQLGSCHLIGDVKEHRVNIERLVVDIAIVVRQTVVHCCSK